MQKCRGVGTLAIPTSATPFFVASATLLLLHLLPLFSGICRLGICHPIIKQVKVYLLFHFFQISWVDFIDVEQHKEFDEKVMTFHLSRFDHTGATTDTSWVQFNVFSPR